MGMLDDLAGWAQAGGTTDYWYEEEEEEVTEPTDTGTTSTGTTSTGTTSTSSTETSSSEPDEDFLEGYDKDYANPFQEWVNEGEVGDSVDWGGGTLTITADGVAVLESENISGGKQYLSSDADIVDLASENPDVYQTLADAYGELWFSDWQDPAGTEEGISAGGAYNELTRLSCTDEYGNLDLECAEYGVAEYTGEGESPWTEGWEYSDSTGGSTGTTTDTTDTTTDAGDTTGTTGTGDSTGTTTDTTTDTGDTGTTETVEDTGTTEDATTKASVDTSQYDVEPETVESRITNLLKQDNPYMEAAQADAMETANTRGLLNTSMAAGAGTDAAISSGFDIASQDAVAINEFRKAAQGQGYTLEQMAEEYGYYLGKMAQAQDFTLEQMATQHGYTLEQLGVEQDYTLEQLAAEHGYSIEELLTEGDIILEQMALQAEMDQDLMELEYSLREDLAELEMNQEDQNSFVTTVSNALSGYNNAIYSYTSQGLLDDDQKYQLQLTAYNTIRTAAETYGVAEGIAAENGFDVDDINGWWNYLFQEDYPESEEEPTDEDEDEDEDGDGDDDGGTGLASGGGTGP